MPHHSGEFCDTVADPRLKEGQIDERASSRIHCLEDFPGHARSTKPGERR